MAFSAARSSSGEAALSSASSHWVRMTAVGVRSSWDASEANCFSAAKEASSRANMLSNSLARVWISSRPGPRSMRRDRSPPWRISRAVRVMRRTGKKARCVSQKPPTAASTTKNGSTTRASRSSWVMVEPTSSTAATVRTQTWLSSTAKLMSYTYQRPPASVSSRSWLSANTTVLSNRRGTAPYSGRPAAS